ncbi:MAG: metallopeptidase TldD-related protein, partial [Bacteroidia bacterium]|nr:metallopeptidase TldD-related protein [Bacteroidia bacterium]
QQRNSFLAKKLGKKIFSKKLILKDTPHVKGLPGSRYWDGDGLATKDLTIIERGRVNSFFINTYTANKMGIAPTVESPSVPKFSLDEFPLKYRNLDAKNMVSLLDKGIFITGFNGGNCNGATGDFSYGIQGFYFEKGEILFPIKEMNISGNIVKLWKNIALIGNDARKCSRWMIPSLAFTDVDFTGL